MFPQALWEHTKAAPLNSFNLVTAVYGDVDLLNIIETVNEGNKQEGEGVAAMALFNYLLLPCTPFSAKWKCSKKIRGILSKILIWQGW